MLKSSAYIQPLEHVVTTSSIVDSVQSEPSKNFMELEELSRCQAPELKLLGFWHDRQADFPILTPIAENLTAAIAQS